MFRNLIVSTWIALASSSLAFAQSTTRISVDSGGTESKGQSQRGRISADGHYIVFESSASNLVPGDTNSKTDVFVHDALHGVTTRVSIGLSGAQGDFGSFGLSLSADGRWAAFNSTSTTFVLGDTNSAPDMFVRDRGAASAFTSFRSGDGNSPACPCANNGSTGSGCENSAGTGGANLPGSGSASLSADTVLLTSSGELPSSLSVVLQGSTAIAAVNFGDGPRCMGGALERLFVPSASGGSTSTPQVGDPSIRAQSATLGDTIPLGATRFYQVYYRDSNLGFCPGGFNATNAVAIA